MSVPLIVANSAFKMVCHALDTQCDIGGQYNVLWLQVEANYRGLDDTSQALPIIWGQATHAKSGKWMPSTTSGHVYYGFMESKYTFIL